MTMEKLIASVTETAVRAGTAQEKANKARGKLREAVEPLLKKAMEEENRDLFPLYRFGRYDLTVLESGEIRVVLRDLSYAKDGKKCGTEIFDSRMPMPWLEEMRQRFREKLGLPPGARFDLSIDGYYYVENK